MRAFRIWLTGCAAVLPLMAATAQQAPAPKVKESVEVAGHRPVVQNLADRQSYTIGSDLQAATGSLSDVLKNLPSVEVDVSGNVTLRGDANVTILIDGKVSPLLAGNRADALEQMQADTIDRIEVITNPSAEFKAEGSAGIINIITKKDSEPGSSGTVRVNAGDEGRFNGSVSGQTKLGRFNLSGSYNERRDIRRNASSLVRSSGAGDPEQQTTASDIKMWMRNVRLGAGVQFDPQNRLQLQAIYAARGARLSSTEHNVADASIDYNRTGLGSRTMDLFQVSVDYTHAFATKGEEFKLEASRGTHWSNGIIDYISTDTVTGSADLWQWQDERERETETEVKASYVLPLASGAKFKAGYALEGEDNLAITHGLLRDNPTVAWQIDDDFNTHFILKRDVHAAYATYEDKFGDFGVLGGLRLEQEFLSTKLLTTGEAHKSSSLRFYPSLHLTYNLADTRQFKLSYSRRVNRPNDEDLSPALESHDAFNAHTGNPLLQPEEIDSFETSYQYAGEKYDARLTGYYRITNKGITDVSYYISPTMLLTTKENLANAVATGLEAAINGTIIKDLSFRLTGNVNYNEINPGATSIYGKRSGMSWSGKTSLDYQLTPDDLLQFSINYSAKRLLPQGYREPTFTGNAGFRHNFSNGLSGVVTVNNLFDSFEHNVVLDSPGVHEVYKQSHPGRVFYLGLVYNFGSASEDSGRETGGENGNGGDE